MSRQEKGPLQLIYERLYVVALATAAALVAAWWIADRMDPVYRSEARCFMPTKSDVLSLTSEAENLPDGPKLPNGVTEVQDSMLGLLRGADLRQRVAAALPERSSADLEENVSFEIDKFNLITISAYDRDPAMAQRIAQEYLKAFRDRLDDSTKAGIRENAQMLTQAIETTLAEVQRVERARQDFLRGQGTVDFGTQFELLADKVKSYTQKVEALDATLAGQEIALTEARKQRDARPSTTDPGEFVPRSTTTQPNPVVDQLKLQRLTLDAEYRTLLQLYKEGPKEVPQLTAKREELRILDEHIASLEQRVVGAESYGPDPLRDGLELRVMEIEVQMGGARAERTQYAALLEQAQREFQLLPEYQLKLDDFGSELAILRQTLANQRGRLAELDLFLRRTTSYLATAEDPALSDKPWFPNVPLILVAAGVLGFVVALAAAVVMAQVARFRQEALW